MTQTDLAALRALVNCWHGMAQTWRKAQEKAESEGKGWFVYATAALTYNCCILDLVDVLEQLAPAVETARQEEGD